MSQAKRGQAAHLASSQATETSGGSILSDDQWRAIARSLTLSEREAEILQCIFDDQTEATIALTLGISPHTVHTHLERLYRKLAVTSRCAAIVRVFAEYVNQQPPSGDSGGPVTGGSPAAIESASAS